jgi:cell fate regulator YaaT (PSP1 superfamily)
MVKIIGIRFRNGGKVYYFDPKDMEVRRGSYAIVETARGVECGRVVLAPREIEDSQVVQPLRPVIRAAGEADIAHEKENQIKEKEAYRICRQKIRDHNLEMKLVQAEYTFDNKKMLFYFTADGRVDFRELVKDLASVFKTRIELRQIGVRDETKMLGGIGTCGRPLCCSTYLSDFAPVSIRMAKEQNLSLNPAKISGVCGRLMCCLKNEEETYEYLNRKLPGVGDVVQTPDGREGEVQSLNVLRQKVRVLIEEGDDKEVADYPAEEITLIQKRKKGGGKPERDHRAPGGAEKSASAAGENGSSGKREARDRRENRREQAGRDGSRREMRESSGAREQERRQRTAAGDRVPSGRPVSEAEGTEERQDENTERRSRRNRRGRRGNRERRNGADPEGTMNREGEGLRARGEGRSPEDGGNPENRNPERPRRRERRRPERGRKEMPEENKES